MNRREGTQIVLSGVTPNVYAVLEHAGFCEMLGKENICPNINVALERAAALAKTLEFAK
jgi:SulP family sulfate permease